MSNGDVVAARFSVLGPIRMWRGTREIDLRPRRLQLMLACLLVRAGEPVSFDELVDLLWPADPPANATNILYQHVGAVRRLVEPGLPRRDPGLWLTRHGTAYQVSADATTLDLLLFRELCRRARTRAARGDDLLAVESWSQALDLWRGTCGEGLDAVNGIHPLFVEVDNERIAAAREAADAALRCSAASTVLPGLRRTAESHPLDESLQARLFACMAAEGNRAKALIAYEGFRARLTEELGVEPGTEISAVHTELLRDPAPVAPAQLPPDLNVFTGRRPELARLGALLDTERSGPMIVTVDGMPGVGKSTLAVHWAHQVAARFPDGQIYLNLRGFGAHSLPMTADEAVRTLLESLGLSADRIPRHYDAAVGLYRSMLATRRLLVILDNARDAGQVIDLLPGSHACAVIVTSRVRLGPVNAGGAQVLGLGLPDRADARELLRRRIGPAGTEPDGPALDEIVDRCDRLPLALALVAGRTVASPGFSLPVIAKELRSAVDALDVLGNADIRSDLRAVFSWSYQALSAPAQRLLRLSSMIGGRTFSAAEAATIAGLTPRQVRALLLELSDSNVITEVGPGQFVLHDLLRAYAAELRGAGRPSDSALRSGAHSHPR
ncbi:AfsR/SARP family transcriptional regulator [Actinoplanes sp. CA-131856]